MLAEIKCKREYLNELVHRPWPDWDRKARFAKCSYKKVDKKERRAKRKMVE